MWIHSRDGRREPPQDIWRLCQITGASILGGKYRQAANGCALVRVVVCLSCPTPLCTTGPAVRRGDRPCPSETLCRDRRILTLCVRRQQWSSILSPPPPSISSTHYFSAAGGCRSVLLRLPVFLPSFQSYLLIPPLFHHLWSEYPRNCVSADGEHRLWQPRDPQGCPRYPTQWPTICHREAVLWRGNKRRRRTLFLPLSPPESRCDPPCLSQY